MPELSFGSDAIEDLKLLVFRVKAKDLSQVINESAEFLNTIIEGIMDGKAYCRSNGKDFTPIETEFFSSLKNNSAWDPNLKILDEEIISERGNLEKIHVDVSDETNSFLAHYARHTNAEKKQILNVALTLYQDAIKNHRFGYSPALIKELATHGNESTCDGEYILMPALKRIAEAQLKTHGIN